MSSLPVSMKKIRSKQLRKSFNTDFIRRSREANSAVGGPIWLKIELIQNIMYVLITCKFKKYRINSNREKEETSIFKHSRTANSLVSCQIACKYQKFRSKTTKKKWRHHFPHYKSMGVFFRLSMADNSIVDGPIWPKFELFLDIMHVLDIYNFKMDRINSNREKRRL